MTTERGTETWGERVLARRLERQMSQTSLAEAARTTQQTISSIERGQSIPRLSTARRIATALDSTLDDLFPAEATPDGDDD